MGEEVSLINARKLLNEENRVETLRIIFESINLDRLERACSTLYVTVVTCMAAGLSENAAKFGLGLNVSSVISHSLLRIVNPAIPASQPLLRFFARAACASLGILAAFRLEKSLLVWANCLLGAELLINAAELLVRGHSTTDENKEAVEPVTMAQAALTRIRTTCVWTIAGAGLVVQVMPGNEMPLWVKGVLIGPRMFEYGLQALSVSMKGGDNRQFFT